MESIVVLGTGPAGLTAAIYAARANLQPLVIEGAQPGGQLTITSDVENYPGFPEGVMGPELMDHFRKQAARFGTRFLTGQVVSVKSTSGKTEGPWALKLEDGSTVETKTLIIATGAAAKWLGIESEKKFYGKGVSACATCDGFFFRNQDIAVVGGGDTAMEEATFLTRFAKSVTIIVRRDTLRASKIMQEKAKSNPKIRFIWDSTIEEILGEQGVQSVKLRNLKNQSTQVLNVTGVFIAIGHEPNTKPFRGWLPMDESGYLKVLPGTAKTDVPGVFAAGDVADPTYRQAVTAAGTGCMAALDAERYLSHYT